MSNSFDRVIFISPLFNAAENLHDLCQSINEQENENWEHIIIDDMSLDSPKELFDKLPISLRDDPRRKFISNKEKKFALRNIIECAREYQDKKGYVIATVDGDDQLCNSKTVSILASAYTSGSDVVWTAHRWDIGGINISREMPKYVNPYSWPWCSSHLRTFRASLLIEISDQNFKNFKNEWFQRGYDQALMLPILHVTNNRQYINEVCYTYRIDSKSIPAAERNYSETKQLSTVNFVRARGFIE